MEPQSAWWRENARFLVSDRSRPDFWGLRPIAGCWLAAALGSGWLREADWRSERRPQRARQHNPQPRHNLTNHYPPQPRPNQSTPISYQGITSQTITPHNQVTTLTTKSQPMSLETNFPQIFKNPTYSKSNQRSYISYIIIIQTVLQFKKRSSVTECFPINPDEKDIFGAKIITIRGQCPLGRAYVRTQRTLNGN